MDPMLILVVALSVLVGLSLGLLGGGGSILLVPLLTYVGGLAPHEAIPTSLVVVGTTSVVSLLGHARKGHVRWRAGLGFGVAAMVGAFGGGLAGGHVPGTVLMVAFAAMMLATAVAMLRGRRDEPGRTDSPVRAPWRVPLYGLLVGAATGLVGAGGGFLVVPALALLAGLPMAAAVGTSLLVISMQSFAGLGGYLTSVSLDWPLVAAIAAASVVGSLAGVAMSSRVSERALRRAFGYVVLAMGVFVLAEELHGVARTVLVAVVVAAVLVTAALCLFTTDHCPLRRRPTTQPSTKEKHHV
ncbi:sulfite exporter TauE/SafE family protein [Dietzia aurantiaca]|uniref:sulfite exporter TauE/SafE family protein n=1 Tax=Dietzia aurantiaca TaxID=983873 RepID=UPI001E42F4F7|nr:sulfite exporter TauE/SafE family protein [Dietzia aurantiaca]MCD2263626.1 sulfite exporter TauE/SafE family protein [Dietzia aurantiaca]